MIYRMPLTNGEQTDEQNYKHSSHFLNLTLQARGKTLLKPRSQNNKNLLISVQ